MHGTVELGSPDDRKDSGNPALEPKGPIHPQSDDEITDLKIRINQIIWEYAPGETTIGMADELACKILCSIRKGKWLI